MARHYEVTFTGGQLAMLLLGAVVLVLVAFSLGVGVGGLGRPAAVPSGEPPGEPPGGPAAAAAPAAVPTEPALLMAEATAPEPTVLPTPVPTTAPEPTMVPTLAPVTPVPTARPAPTSRPDAAPHRGAWVQAGAFTRQASAEGVRQRVIALGFTPAQVRVVRGGDGKYRVWVGPFPDDESAGRVSARMRVQGFPGAFVVNE